MSIKLVKPIPTILIPDYISTMTYSSDSAYCDTCYRSMVCRLSVYMSSVTLVHTAKATGRNKMPDSRDTRVVPNNIVGLLYRSPGPSTERGDLEI